MDYKRLTPVALALFLGLAACQSNNNTAAPHSEQTTTQEVAVPAALANYAEIKLPFELAQEADLAALGWSAGTVKYFKTTNGLFGTLTCKSAEQDFTSMEVQVYNAQGQTVGKAEEYYLTTRGASAESIMINLCSMRIADDLLTVKCSNTVDNNTSESEDKVQITAQGLAPMK